MNDNNNNKPVRIGPVEKRECPGLCTIAELARDVYNHGLDGVTSEQNLRNLVGRFASDLCKYDMLDVPDRSLGTLLVRAYIKKSQKGYNFGL